MDSDGSGQRRLTLRRMGDGDFGARMKDLWASPWVKALVALLALLAAGYGAILYVFARDLPSVESLRAYEPALPTTIRSIDGTPIRDFARERRVELSFAEYPRPLVNAFLAAEDRTFFSHGGLDYPGIAAAIFNNLRSDDRPVGASTITQQVARNLLLTNEVSYVRKVREAILAYRMEDALTKEQILELYLNQIFLGRNAYGVQAAARAYFDKDVERLSLAQMAYLAILPKAPSGNYSAERNPDRAIARRNWVLGQMAEHGLASPADVAVHPKISSSTC